MDAREVIPQYPRFNLATLPTPLERMPVLERALRDEGIGDVPALYLKRDDLLSLALGGNKVRNLEFSIGAALAAGATDIVTMGQPQSNHCRLTAAACARAGLRAHLVIGDARPEQMTGNLLLDELLGARLYFTGVDDQDERAALAERVALDIELAGRRAALLPVGGSDARGALGHVVLAHELLAQCADAGVRLGTVALATATGGTQAGLIAGFALAGADVDVRGYAVADPAGETSQRIAGLAAEVCAELGTSPVSEDSVHVDDASLGAAYGVPSPDGDAAATFLARTEGVFADPVYTGKGFAGLLRDLRARSFDADLAVVFIHTGGQPALFAKLPATRAQ